MVDNWLMNIKVAIFSILSFFLGAIFFSSAHVLTRPERARQLQLRDIIEHGESISSVREQLIDAASATPSRAVLIVFEEDSEEVVLVADGRSLTVHIGIKR